jgi:hypothetical protein
MSIEDRARRRRRTRCSRFRRPPLENLEVRMAPAVFAVTPLAADGAQGSLRNALAVALCLGDDAATDRLLEWPGRDLGFDEGYWDRTRADNAYQIWLASRLRGEPAESTADLLEQALGSKRKRPKLLAATAQALLAGDSAGFTRSLTAYLRYYRTSELNPQLVRIAMSVEGTALWHLARRRGLEVGGIPEDLMLLIPRP